MKYTYIILFLTTVMHGQEGYEGTVIDSSTLPIEFATVVSIKKDSTIINYTLTDKNGRFLLEKKTNHPAFIKISFLGFKDKLIPISENSQLKLGQIKLEESSTSLAEVTITAEKPLIERQIDRLVINVNKAAATAGSNALDILERSPGVLIDLNGGISLRGRPQVIVMVNGKRQMLSGDELTSYLRGIPESALEKIELIHQPSAAYDAEGSGGIINIVLKNADIFGSNGSVNASVGRGVTSRSSVGFNYNYKNEKVAINASTNYSYVENFVRLKTIRRYANDEGDLDAVLQNDSESIVPSKNVLVSLGLGYNFLEKFTAGINLQGNRAQSNQDGDGFTEIFSPDDELTGGFATESISDDTNLNYTISPYSEWNINDKSSLKLDGTLARYKRDTDQGNTTDFFNAENTFFQSDTLKGVIDGQLDLLAMKADYKLTLKDTSEFSAGLKASAVKNDNDLYYTDQINGQPVVNETYTNRFIYEENIQAAYINWNKSWKSLSLQLGLRTEHTEIKGDQRTTGEIFERDYTQVFPSAFLQYKWKDFHSLGFNVGRRINRPNYGQLNPFRFFVDITTFRSGNPNLIPEISWNFEISYSYKSIIDLSASYSRTEDNIIFVIQQNDDTRTTAVLPVNIGSYDYLGLNASSTIKPWDWLRSSINLELFYNEFIGQVSGFDLAEKAFSFRVNGSNSIEFSKKLSGEINYFYQPTYNYGISRFDPRWRIDLGLQKKILDSNGTIKLAVTDIFRQFFPTGGTNFGNINESFESTRDTRIVSLSFQYNFGNNKIKSTKKGSGAADEELKRIG